MNPLYRGWWRLLMDLRPMVRFFAERFPKLAPWGVRLRAVFHRLVGNPVQVLVVVDALLVWWVLDLPARWLLAVVAGVWLFLEIVHRVCYRSGFRLIGWREAWWFRRRWPAEWAGVAAKTTRVQAEVGTSKEPIASAVLRPIADHPKLSWWPRIEWPVVSWWVGPPPGRSLQALDHLAVVLAANISRAADIHVEYERENDSHGRLIVSFDDVLSRPSSPTWAGSVPAPAEIVEADDLADAVEAFDRTDQAWPPLRIIDGEGEQ